MVFETVIKNKVASVLKNMVHGTWSGHFDWDSS